MKKSILLSALIGIVAIAGVSVAVLSKDFQNPFFTRSSEVEYEIDIYDDLINAAKKASENEFDFVSETSLGNEIHLHAKNITWNGSNLVFGSDNSLSLTSQISGVKSILVDGASSYDTLYSIDDSYNHNEHSINEIYTFTGVKPNYININNIVGNISSIKYVYSCNDESIGGQSLPSTNNEHASVLPFDIDSDTNLYEIISYETGYYASGGIWDTSNGNVCSITFPVKPGYQIYASSFESGIRYTLLNDNTVVKTYAPSETASQYSKNGGYIIVPDGVNCINVPFTSPSTTNACRILNSQNSNLYSVKQELVNVNSSIGTVYEIGEGSTFQTKLTAPYGYIIDNIQVYYNDVDVTETNYVNNTVTIENVEHRIRIVAEASIHEYATELPETNNSHAQELPEFVDCESDLYDLLDKENIYYNGSSWTTNGNVGSITFPVEPGFKIYASSFESKSKNGGTSDGIRITFFYDDTVILSMSPAETYEEFSKNGYITVPDGVNCINVPFWDINSTNNDCFITNIIPLEGFTLTQNLVYVKSSVSNITRIVKGSNFVATLTPKTNYVIESVSVLYGTTDVTDVAYVDGVVTINDVQDAIVINATAIRGESSILLPDTTNSHASELPFDIWNDTNLWEELEQIDEYYLGTAWGKNPSAANAGSVTFAVFPGYRIVANSFGSMPDNEGTANGIRVAYFYNETLVRAMTTDETYAEFSKNGYLTVPNGVNCINVAVWNLNSSNNFVNIINIEDYEPVEVSFNLTNAKVNKPYEYYIPGSNIVIDVSANSGYRLSSIVVMSDGVDISDTAVVGNAVKINNIQANITITVVAEEYEGDIILPTTNNARAQSLPSDITNETNLCDVLTTVTGYYVASGWQASGAVSIIIPVKPGYHIKSSSMGKSGTNGSSVTSGIRMTYLYDDTVISSKSPGDVYSEYTTNGSGYITVPENVNCMSVAFWSDSPSNYLYILNVEEL